MALLKYSDLLALGKDKIKEVMAPLRAKEMQKKGELELAKLENTIAEYSQHVQETAAVYPIDFHALIDALDRVAITQRRYTVLEQTLTELFAEKSTPPTPLKSA